MVLSKLHSRFQQDLEQIDFSVNFWKNKKFRTLSENFLHSVLKLHSTGSEEQFRRIFFEVMDKLVFSAFDQKGPKN